MSRVAISNHPLVRHKLARLRDANTTPAEFRALVAALSQILIVEALADAPTRPIRVTTPLIETTCDELAERIGLVPVLRAGLGMADAIHIALPEAAVWHVGLYREHDTLQPKEYYNRLPADHGMDLALVLDPMLATGGSAIHAIQLLKAVNVKRVKFLGLIAAPEGVAALSAAHPEVMIHLGACDEKLNEVGYILPGLGDAGDRQFGTR